MNRQLKHLLKKGLLLAVLSLMLLSLAACGKYVSSYKALMLVHSNRSDSADMSFSSFEGRMVFKLKSSGEGDLKYTARLESGSATVYYDCYGTKSELFSIAGGEEADARGGYVESGTVYVIVETDGACKNGEFHISLN